MDVLLLNSCNDEIKELFARFVPVDYLALFEKEDTIIIGAVDTDEDGMEPVGVSVVSAEEGYFAIRWMWTDPEMRMKGAGEKMLKAIMDIAYENALNSVYAYVPALETEDVSKSDITEFFYNNSFIYKETKEADKVKVYVLSADTDIYKSMDNEMLNDAVREARIEKGYSKFPKNFVEKEVEYYSGVKIDV